MKDMEDFIINLVKDVNDILYGKAKEPKADEDEYQRGYNDAKNYFRMMQRAFTEKVEILEAEVLAIGGEREYLKSRVDALNAEVERLTEELSKTENVSHVPGEEITVEPAPWSFIRLMDKDGDLWAQRTTINGRLWHCETEDWVQPLSFSDLKDTYGPLHLPHHRSK